MLCSGCSFPSSAPPFHVVHAFAVIVTILFFPVNLGISVLPCVTQCTHKQSASYTTWDKYHPVQKECAISLV